MVGPVNSGSVQQAIANPFQQQNNRVSDDQRQQEVSRTQAARTQETGITESRGDRGNDKVKAASAPPSETQSSSGRERERGGLVDISV